MKTASVSEAKNKLSAYLRLVKQGQEVVILDRDVPVARLVPVVSASQTGDEALFQTLESRGILRRAKQKATKQYLLKLPPAPKIKGDILSALLADREEGR
jgi:prevent-host-death family protein